MQLASVMKRFQRRVRQALAGQNPKQFCDETGFPRGTLYDWLSDSPHAPRLDRLVELANHTKRPLAWFFDEDSDQVVASGQSTPAEDADTLRIPLMDAIAAAGAGSFNEQVHASAHLPFPRVLFSRRTRHPDAVHAMRCKGESMEPTIADGALVFYDHRDIAPPKFRRNRKRQSAEMYVFLDHGEIRLKRIMPLEDGSLMLISDNAVDFAPEVALKGEEGRIKILGKVIWWDNRL
ncbi:MAG: S24 family peptidase [Hyphomicrobiales bacterium]|nr:S24 family peptidase [Hyphomicrobiales bacterium]